MEKTKKQNPSLNVCTYYCISLFYPPISKAYLDALSTKKNMFTTIKVQDWRPDEDQKG